MKQRHRRPDAGPGPGGQSADAASTPKRSPRGPDDLLDLLGDEFTREAIEAIRGEPMSGAAVADATSMSQPTAFRRLNDLAELGLVGVRRRIDPDDGHHHKEYHLVVETLSVSLGGEDLAVTVEGSDTVDDPAVASARGD